MRFEDKDPERHASIEYPMEVSAPKFAPVNVYEEKDKAINVARQNAKQEYDRIMEQAEVLVRQAKALQARLDATEMVHAAKCQFSPLHGRIYHLYFDRKINQNILIQTAPEEWTTGVPEKWEYQMTVRKLGDSTWEVVDPE